MGSKWPQQIEVNMKDTGVPRAERCAAIAPFHVMSLVQQAAELEQQGVDVIHLGIGEPNFATPTEIVAAGQQARADGKTRYTPALGLTELRQAISNYYAETLAVVVPWQRIVLTLVVLGPCSWRWQLPWAL